MKQYFVSLSDMLLDKKNLLKIWFWVKINHLSRNRTRYRLKLTNQLNIMRINIKFSCKHRTQVNSLKDKKSLRPLKYTC